MPTLVHITDEKNSARIQESGIALGKYRSVIYFMPVVQDHFISHQWLRELRRRGARVLVGVYFRLPSDELVWAGKYSSKHQRLPLGQAIRDFSALADPLGYEMFIERKIDAAEITKIRHLPQKIGWRYQPHAHRKPPCGCPACLDYGSYGSRKIREKYDSPPIPVPYEILKARIAESSQIDVLLDCLWALCNKRRTADPSFLEHLLTIEDAELQEVLARTLAHFRHEKTKRILLGLCKHESAEVKTAAIESLVQLYRQDAIAVLGPLVDDPAISIALADSSLEFL
ncbi:HEAT repeat domain-containing protein [Trichocoleus sp. FACHB-262]|uniref:HEAT repeat domain-containing protein n=1 Tax=Trichocoleus sp. FACHB-262 TaxID=2692869 RepID=UPI001689F0EF|nr:HEAT repeat domain-containing protein [Trichocoleus sp. FACHB-262]MBD2121719.1 HEAT repeat domain-containing protein [Trichocoleus sp. FACHB-262]